MSYFQVEIGALLLYCNSLYDFMIGYLKSVAKWVKW